ncbi:hypothetical protein D3C86_1188520 [compost metagenome]
MARPEELLEFQRHRRRDRKAIAQCEFERAVIDLEAADGGRIISRVVETEVERHGRNVDGFGGNLDAKVRERLGHEQDVREGHAGNRGLGLLAAGDEDLDPQREVRREGRPGIQRNGQFAGLARVDGERRLGTAELPGGAKLGGVKLDRRSEANSQAVLHREFEMARRSPDPGLLEVGLGIGEGKPAIGGVVKVDGDEHARSHGRADELIRAQVDLGKGEVRKRGVDFRKRLGRQVQRQGSIQRELLGESNRLELLRRRQEVKTLVMAGEYREVSKDRAHDGGIVQGKRKGSHGNVEIHRPGVLKPTGIPGRRQLLDGAQEFEPAAREEHGDQ